MANQPTIVVAKLDDEKLKASIDKMVNDLNAGLNKMTANTDAAVAKMQASLQSVGNVKFDSSGSDGGSTRRTKKLQEEENSVNRLSQQYDQLSASMQKTSRSESPIQTMQTQLDLMIEQLRNARSQYSSFVELAAHATTTGDKGLFQFATENVHRYEQEVHDLIPQIRNMRDAMSQMGNVLAPQGHAIENYVKSIQKANPELALLNQQYKRGVALLQQKNIGLKRTAEEERKAAEETRIVLQKEAQYAATSAQREKQRREDIIKSAQAAKELSRELIKGMSTGDVEMKYQNYAKLKDYFDQMRQVYYNFMSTEERESPIGKALSKDINVVGAAIRVLKEYTSAFNKSKHESSKSSNPINNQSIDSLKNSIKTLADAYNRMTVEEMRAGKDTRIIEKFQRLSREAQVLQRRLSTPVSLSSAMKLPERTLDEIAYKMKMLANYRLNLNIFDQKEKSEIDAVNKALDRLGKEQSKILGNNKEMLASNNALIRSFNYMKNRLAFYFTVGASTQFVKNLIEIRSQYEMNERALGILINSAERGTQIFKELSEMALVSPYTLIELSTAAKQLTAYDIAAKDVVDTTRRLADMASAVGIPIERLTYALGQIKAYGYLNSRDARMFANAGIPLVKQLADYYTQLEGRIVSTADVYDRMKKKAIDYNDVMSVVTKMTDEGGKFFDFQAKMAETLKVQIANLTLAWNNMLNDMGNSTQGILSGSIGALKELFLHWKDIDQILKSILLAFGLFKLAQMTALAFTGELNTAIGAQVLLGTKLQQKLAGMTAGYKTMSLGISAAGAAMWLFIADAIMTYNRNAEEIERLNTQIRNGAEEASKAMYDMLHSSEMVANRLAADSGKLTVSEATKTWEALRGQIEMSASSSKAIVAELIKEEDLNARVSKAFTLAESIQKATSKLSELNNELDITQDSILYGAFGEGLVEDIEDYNKHLKRQVELDEWATKKHNGFFENTIAAAKAMYDSITEDMGSSSEEAENEIKNFAHNAAETIREELGEEGLKDKIQVNEAVARVLSGIEQMFPQIRGKGKALFEELFYDIMSKEFSGAVDKQEFYYDKFLERLKKDHASAFSDVTDEILEDTHTWSTAQTDAIQKTADKLRKDMPEASQSAIDDILRQLNTTEFKVRIVAEMATSSLEGVQKEFRDRFINKPWIADQKKREKEEAAAQQRYGTLMRKNGEDNVAYEKRISDERKKQLEISQKNASIIANNAKKQGDDAKAVLEDAKKAKAVADQWLEDAKTIESWGGYDFSTKKENTAANKARHEAETELQKALKNELQLIEKVRSNYKELTKAGVTHAEAISSAISGYDHSVANINAVLKKYGIGLDLSKFAGNNNPHALLAMLQKQLDALKGKAKPSEIQALEVEIQKVKLDVDKFDTTQITNALNRELGNIKDEYELALELDANPELGDMFADMFGIDTDALPQTFAEAFDKANKVAMQKLQELKVNIDSFDLMSTAIKPDENGQWMGLAYDSAAVQELVKAQKEWRDMYRKNLESTEKMLDDYVKKFGDYSDKMAAIEAKRLAQMKELNNVYYTEEMRRSQDYITKLNAINAAAENEKGQVKWDEFKNSSLYVTMFENLEYASTKTLEAIHQKLEELKGDWKQLTPEQLKTITDKYLQIETQLSKRNPFKGLIKNAKEYAKAVGSTGKQAQERFRTAQKQYDEEKEVVAALKKQKEALESANQTKTEQYKIVIDSLALEETELETRKKELAAAQKLVEKYDLMRKIFKSQTSSVAAMLNIASANLQGLGEFRDTLNSLFGVDGSKGETVLGHNLDGVIDGLSKAGQAMSSIVSSATSGNVFGVLSGTVNLFAGIGDSISSIFGGGAAKTRKLNREINNSIENVRKLSLAYKDLERAVETEMGSAELQARRQEMVNKESQLRELQRQKQLEEQKRSKDRDDDRIKELESSIKDLQIELAEMADEIAATLLGSKVKDAAEEFVSTWVDAWRAGEDTMAALDSKFDDMIDNMIMKSIASRVVASHLQQIWDTVDAITKESSEGGSSVTMNELDRIKSLIGDKSIREAINDDLKALYTALGIAYGSDAEKSLSALQQGISGITEDQAGALEAYWNINTQQQFVHTDLLTQIRDIVSGFDTDIQTATLGQILLQLRSSYEIQSAIHSLLSGWSADNERAVRVELIS